MWSHVEGELSRTKDTEKEEGVYQTMERSSSEVENGASSPSSSSPKYRGVRKRKWGKWVSEIRLPNSRERIWLGSYDTPEKAARAFDAAQFCLRGSRGRFNFPESPPEIAGAGSLAPHEIQAVASRFANGEEAAAGVAGGGGADEESRGRVLGGAEAANAWNSASLEVDETTTDWSFLGVLDSNVVGSFPGMEYNYSQSESSEYFFDDYAGEDDLCHRPSFLWNF